MIFCRHSQDILGILLHNIQKEEDAMISLRNFLIAYALLLIGGLAIISGQDILMILTQERHEAKVVGFADAGEKKLYKPGTSYQEKHLAPVLAVTVNGIEERLQAKYECKDGCHKLGSSVTVYLDNQNSKNFLVMTFKDFWSGPVYFLIVMMAFILFSIGHIQPANKPPVCELND
jgi:hypothetical protein